MNKAHIHQITGNKDSKLGKQARFFPLNVLSLNSINCETSNSNRSFHLIAFSVII